MFAECLVAKEINCVLVMIYENLVVFTYIV